jgi:flagellar hook assembly protein FlgD
VTTIKFDIKEKGLVRLCIYNVAGQLVRTLVDEELEAASHTREWKGLNDGGSKVASGVYFYRLEAGAFESVKKMVLLR